MTFQKVFLVRHGETDYNLSGRWQGSLDIPLNAMGREQADCVAQALQGESIQRIYASDLSRALETAQIIAKSTHVESIETDSRLKEISVGVFQGLTRQQIIETYPLEFSYWQHDDDYAVPNGESRIALRARVREFWQEVIEPNTTDNLVLVSHGGTIRWLLNVLFSPEVMLGRHIENTSISLLERRAAGWDVVKIGDITHLSALSASKASKNSL